MKLVNLLNEARFRWKYKELPEFRQEPESVTGYRIVRRERGEDANVTLDDMMKILRNEEFVSNFKNKSYVFWVELKTTRARKKVAFVHIFNVNNLPDYILPNIQTPYTTINGAKIFIKDPKKDVQRGDEKVEDETTVTTGGQGVGGSQGDQGYQGSTGANGDKGATSTAGKIPSGTPLLKRGSRGESVKQLQTLLGLTGDSVDGIFGPETTAWLTVWQAEHGFTGNDIDGIYGPKTAAAMKKDSSPVKDTAKAIKLTTNVKDVFVSKTTTSKPAGTTLSSGLFKQLETKFPKVFKGSYTFKMGGGKTGDTVKRLSIGSPTQAETYEAAMKKNITGFGMQTREDVLLDIFEKISKQQLTTLFNSYQKINGTKLAHDLKNNAFDESEMSKLKDIFLKKGLKLSNYQ